MKTVETRNWPMLKDVSGCYLRMELMLRLVQLGASTLMLSLTLRLLDAQVLLLRHSCLAGPCLLHIGHKTMDENAAS